MWQRLLPLKVEIVNCWKILNDVILTRVNLTNKGIALDTRYPLCYRFIYFGNTLSLRLFGTIFFLADVVLFIYARNRSWTLDHFD